MSLGRGRGRHPPPRGALLTATATSAAAAAASAAASAAGAPSGANAAIDLALAANALAFLQHPVCGGPSYDALEFFAGNPVYSGSGSLPWVVNGFLYPMSADARQQSILAGEYGSGYAGHSQMRALWSEDGGATWAVGPVVVAPNASLYDHGGLTPDGSAVVDGNTTHIVYDWGNLGGPGAEVDGGLGYAAGPARGPFARSPVPIVQQSTEAPQPLLPQYRMVYGGTLFRRAADWLVLAAMSTTDNAGGTWGMCCLTNPNADPDPAAPGANWSQPKLLLVPQSATWHASPTEFYPAFSGGDDGFVYAPSTGLAGPNRNYQLVWRARLEDAHLPEAWEVLHDGSAFHWEGRPGQPSIWGQTFSAFVDRAAGRLRIMYPALSGAGIGSMNLASAPWVPAPDDSGSGSIGQRDSGFWLSAPPGASAIALTSGALGAAAELDVTAVLVGGGFSLLWNHNAPFGANAHPFPSNIAAATLCNATAFAVTGSSGEWQLLSLPPARSATGACTPVVVASGANCTVASDGAPLRLQVSQSAAGLVDVRCGGAAVVAGAPAAPAGGAAALGGRTALLASGSALNVSSFVVASGWLAPPLPPLALLAVEGMLGAANTGGGWAADSTPGRWRFGGGFVCSAGASDCEHAAKFNFVGSRVSLWAPRGLPGAGTVSVSVDGAAPESVDISGPAPAPSAEVWSSAPLTPGRHALVVRANAGGTLPVDSVDVVPVQVPS